MVAEMELMAEVLRFKSKEAREEREGETEDCGPVPDMRREEVGGRWETQSWTRRETWGFAWRLDIFLEAGLVVIMMMGEGEKEEDGR